MTTGGLLLEPLPDGQRERLAIAPGEMALRVKHVGQYGPHAAAKRAGFRAGDVIIQFDGRNDLLTDTALLSYGVTNCMVDEKVDVVVLRNGKKQRLVLPMQP